MIGTAASMSMEASREHMVRTQLAARGIVDSRVLEAMRRVPRECFVAEEFAPYAYDDGPLPIAEGQTISQPFVVAYMIEVAAVQPGDRVLEVGTGSGYAAAVLAQIAAEVHTVERHAPLVEAACERLRRLGCGNVSVHHGDGSTGWPEAAPFDVVIVSAAGPAIPDALLHQLAPGGRLVMPVGEGRGVQRLRRLRRAGEDQFEEEDLAPVAFVPLIGEHAWDEAAGDPRPPPFEE
jgi:protein-L-isoaspartate(D-aspartate) O-methyltransferase